MIAVVSITICIAVLLRILPHRLITGNLGVDRWYWKAYIETYRRDRKFPPVLPQYLLDEHQWYPPLFPLLMAHLPKAVFESYQDWIAILIDLLRMGLLLGVTNWLTGSELYAVGVAGLVYATTPILVSYNIELNPRGLGALFLDGLIILLLWRYLLDGPIWVWGLIILLAGLILLTHKMTTQLFWFLCLGTGFLTLNWRFFALIPASILTALIISKGFYWKLLKAHWDIVSFWTRNWLFLGANPLRESPIYGVSGYTSLNRQFQPGLKNLIKRIGSIFLGVYSPWITGALLLLLLSSNLGQLERFISVWFLLCVGFAFLTIAIPFLRGLGFGNLYLFNAAFPAGLLLGMFVHISTNYVFPVLLVFLGVNIFSLFRSMSLLKSHKGITLPKEIIDQIIPFGPGAWICYPMQLCEHVAYLAKKPVLWGGHGYGFNNLLKKVFPVVRTRFEDLIEKYGLRYILVEESCLADIERIEINKELKLSMNGFYIFEL